MPTALALDKNDIFSYMVKSITIILDAANKYLNKVKEEYAVNEGKTGEDEWEDKHGVPV